MTTRGISTDIEGGKHTAECPFCRTRIAFSFAYDGLMCEYRTKCPHVLKVSRDLGVMVYFQCSAAAPSSSPNSAESLTSSVIG